MAKTTQNAAAPKPAELTPENYGEALKLAQETLEKYPRFGMAWALMGTLYLQMERYADALLPLQNAALYSPDNPDVQSALGVALMHAGRFGESEACLNEAVRLKPDYAEAYYNLGMLCYRQERFAGAEAALRAATARKPDYPDALINLGLTLQALSRLAEAEGCFRQVLALMPDSLGALNNLGNVLSAQGRLPDAEACYRQALQLSPNFVDAYENLGTLLMDVGRIDEAEAAFGRALELAPDSSRVLARALVYLPYRKDDPRFSQLDALYANRDALPLAERIRLNFSMGRAMEKLEEYDRAFAALEEGNRLHYAAHPFDEAAEESMAEKLCTLYNAQLLDACALLEPGLTPVRDARVPVFIVGMPRSGSTLVEQMLASHPEIHGGGELDTFKAVMERHVNAPDGNALERLRDLGRQYLDEVWKLAPGARHITDKLPHNYTHAGLIHLMLPQAKIIHTVRDPLDTCLSCYALQFTNGHEYSYDLAVLGRQYNRYARIMRHWESVLPPGRILAVRYEDCVADPEKEARRMLEHIGLAWDANCLNFHKADRPVRTASVTQVRKPIYSTSVQRWKRFERHLAPLVEALKA